MASATQVFSFVLDWRAAWRDDDVNSALELNQRHAKRVLMSCKRGSSSVEQRQNSFCPSAAVNLNIEMDSDASFPPMRE